MRVACKLGREVLDEAAKAIAPGVTTDEIDRFRDFILQLQKQINSRNNSPSFPRFS